MNKRGMKSPKAMNIVAGVIFAVLFIVSIILIYQSPLSIGAWDDGLRSSGVSFGNAFNNDVFGFLDFIFGKIPQHLATAVSDTGSDAIGGEISAGIITIGVWFLVLLFFGDILGLFGMFSKGVAWIAAVIL